MNGLLTPKSVAIIGASNDETKLGGMLLKNMINAGFEGNLYPVNPKGGEIQGLKAYTSITEIPEPVDLAVISIKAAFVPDEMANLKKNGCHCATILTAGFKEDSPEGKKLEEKLVKCPIRMGIAAMMARKIALAKFSLDSTLPT